MLEKIKSECLCLKEYKSREFILYNSDITKLEVDCIVNAANNELGDGAGINGAICDKGGKDLLKEMKSHKYCYDGQTIMTEPHGLPCKKILHTVGPRYSSIDPIAIESSRCKLSSCYYQSLSLANKNKLCSIGFPCISTGIFSYPLKEATHVAINTILDYFDDHPDSTVKAVIFCVFTEEQVMTYMQLLESIIV